jgi:hypothetical protein
MFLTTRAIGGKASSVIFPALAALTFAAAIVTAQECSPQRSLQCLNEGGFLQLIVGVSTGETTCDSVQLAVSKVVQCYADMDCPVGDSLKGNCDQFRAELPSDCTITCDVQPISSPAFRATMASTLALWPLLTCILLLTALRLC